MKRTEAGWTLLQTYLMKNDKPSEEITKSILHSGVDVNKVDCFRMNALFSAAQNEATPLAVY